MKNYLWILIIFYVLEKVNSICQANCKTCSNEGLCIQCLNGFLLSSHAQCLVCPWLSTVCKLNEKNIPIATACANSSVQIIIDQNTNLCTFCSSACLTCDKTATNCTSCYEGFYLSGNQCLKNSTCSSIAYCNNCAPEESGSTLLTCTECFKGYFAFGRGCVQCNNTCSKCEVSQQGLWNDKGLPWFTSTMPLIKQKANENTKKRRLLQNISAFTDSFTKWTNTEWDAASWTGTVWQEYNKIDPKIVRKALYVYNFFKAICRQLAVNRTQTDIVYESLFLFEDLLKIPLQKNQTDWKYLAKFVTQITNIKWNHFELKNSVDDEATGYINCTECQYSYYVGISNVSSNKFCLNCSQNCSSCTSFDVCTACNYGFYLSSTNSCQMCSEKCSTCYGTATNCTSCPQGTYLDLLKFTCPVCSLPCRACDENNPKVCKQCVAGYSRLPDNNNKCYRCIDPYCLHCSSTNTSICLVCRGGYFRANNTCHQCPQNCYRCIYLDSQDAQYCYISEDKYALSVNYQQVQACSQGCSICLDYNANTCFSCEPLYYYLDRSTQKCLKCPKYCYACNNFGECLTPEFGYIFFDTELAKCRVGCQNCDQQDPEKCMQCDDGYYLDKGYCYACQVGCDTCSSKSKCEKCQTKYELVNGTCLICQGNCQECNKTNLSQCTSCRYNYILSNGQCLTNQKCSQGCERCDPSNLTNCQQCKLGYGQTPEGKCVKCLSSCQAYCMPTDIAKCDSCLPGYELELWSCRKCPENAVRCLFNNVLLICKDGYFVQNGACVKFCDLPCLTCVNNTGKCQTCQPGYNLTSDSQCIFDQSCNPFCDYCPGGYWENPNTASCDKCPQNCQVCKQSTCVICKDNYYIDNTNSNGVCVSCKSPCKTCDDSVTCLSCIDGYLLEVRQLWRDDSAVIGIETNRRCMKCDSNCLTCLFMPTYCLTCTQPKILKDTKCVGGFPVKFEYKFNIQYNNFLNNNKLTSFLDTLAKQLQIPKQKISVDYIKRGSTIVGGNILAESQSEATTIQNKVSNPNSMSTFDTTQSDSSTTVDNQPNGTSDSDSKLSSGAIAGIIVGSVVGGLLIIGIIIFVCCKIRKHKEQKIAQSNAESENQWSAPITSQTLEKHPHL